MRNLRSLDVICCDAQQRSSVCIFANESVVVRQMPLDLIDRLCIRCGSTRKGRQEAFRALTGAVQKIPVLISEDGPLLMPTLSPESGSCVWIAYDSVLRMKPEGDDMTNVLFLDGTSFKVNVNVRVLRSQAKRCELFRRLLNEFKEHPEDFLSGNL
ncbi:MAG: competence protein ComK [Solobacterium sp.]|nr:competence protein ComK [Solobacterium sp.]